MKRRIILIIILLGVLIGLLYTSEPTYTKEVKFLIDKSGQGMGLTTGISHNIISDKLNLVLLYNIIPILLILAGILFFLSHLVLIRRLRKFKAAINRISQGEYGYPVSSTRKGVWGRLANDFDKMSRKMKEESDEQLSRLNNLTYENLFHSQMLQMILLLQTTFRQKELPAIISQFLPRFFPGDPGALLLQSEQDNLETVAIWGADQTPVGMSYYECLALWEGQVHCGPRCNSRFQCKFDIVKHKICICVPIGRFGLLRILSDADERQLVTKKKRASIVAEHLRVIWVSFKIRENLRNRSLRDPLTGLFNRRFMDEALTLEIARAARQRETLGVIMLDLDHFKRFNDKYGHSVGDDLLKEMGLWLRKYCRSGDIACRYGGEEFAIIMAEANEKNIAKRVEELRFKLGNFRIRHNYKWLTGPTFSAGIAIYPHHGNTPETLLKSADRALYRAKEMGRNRICVAGEDRNPELFIVA
jgi:diguanylate cyclase (GGDEF)-like protein